MDRSGASIGATVLRLELDVARALDEAIFGGLAELRAPWAAIAAEPGVVRA